MMVTSSCSTCPKAGKPLHTIGIEHWDYHVALAGNPNTGKSTVFNALTGLHQHTGNWPGKTVARAEGFFTQQGKRFKLIDLPGTYSLLSTSVDEEIARNHILFDRPDVTVIVADASRLERNLNLVLQVLEITPRAILCLNLMDEAKRHGIEIDVERLQDKLGVAVIPTVARSKRGLDFLKQAVFDVATNHIVQQPYGIHLDEPLLNEAVDQLVSKIEIHFPHLPNARWIALRILEGDEQVLHALWNGTLSQTENENNPDGFINQGRLESITI